MLAAAASGRCVVNARSLRRRRQVDELVDRVAIDELVDAQGPIEIAPSRDRDRRLQRARQHRPGDRGHAEGDLRS